MDLPLLWDVSYGMYVVGVNDGEKATGCIVNTIVQITSENPVFAISLHKNNYTTKTLMKTKKACISILSENFPGEYIGTLGFQSGENIDKFSDIPHFTAYGMPVPTIGICGYFTADLVSYHEMETHIVAFVKVNDLVKFSDEPPMTYKYYHQVIKGRAPKNAPTFIEADLSENKDEEKYVCKICGYIHEGPLPDNFICPICSMGKDKFNKI